MTVHDSSLFDTLGDDIDGGRDGNDGNDGNGDNGDNDGNDDDKSNVYADSCNHGAFSVAVTIYGVWETQHACGLVYKFVKQ